MYIHLPLVAVAAGHIPVANEPCAGDGAHRKGSKRRLGKDAAVAICSPAHVSATAAGLCGFSFFFDVNPGACAMP